MNGRSTSGTTGLGTVEVRGRRRVPSPPARIKACMVLSAADAFVDESGRPDGVAVDEVPSVDHESTSHLLRGPAPVKLADLWPLRDEHAGVGTGDRFDCRVRKLNADHQLARLGLGNWIVRSHSGA